MYAEVNNLPFLGSIGASDGSRARLALTVSQPWRMEFSLAFHPTLSPFDSCSLGEFTLTAQSGSVSARFSCQIYLNPATLTVAVGATFARDGVTLIGGLRATNGTWREPFGIRGLEIIEVVVGLKLPGSFGLMFNGSVIIASEVRLGVGVVLSTDPTNRMLSGSVSSLKPSHLIRFVLTLTGIDFPTSMLTMFDFIELRDTSFYFSPSGARFGDQVFRAGAHLHTTIRFLGTQLRSAHASAV